MPYQKTDDQYSSLNCHLRLFKKNNLFHSMAQISVNKNIVIYIAKCLTEMDMIIILSSQSRSVHPVENTATCHEHPLQSSQWTLQPTVQCLQSMFYKIKERRAMEYITHLRNISERNTSLSKDMIIQEGWVKITIISFEKACGLPLEHT